MELDLRAVAVAAEREILADPPPGIVVHQVMLLDTDPVLRGGRNAPKTLESGLEKTRRSTDRRLSAISGASGRGMSVEDILRVRPFPNPSICRTTAGRLRSKGLGVVLTGPIGHCSILIPTGMSMDDAAWLAILSGCFEGPLDNPSRLST